MAAWAQHFIFTVLSVSYSHFCPSMVRFLEFKILLKFSIGLAFEKGEKKLLLISAFASMFLSAIFFNWSGQLFIKSVVSGDICEEVIENKRYLKTINCIKIILG
jgi:hypothetical protein